MTDFGVPSRTTENSPGQDALFAHDGPKPARAVTVASGAGILKRGTVLGQITSGGKYVTSLAAGSDGSEVPAAILAEDIDATAADKLVNVYLGGYFRREALTFGTGHTADSTRAALRDVGIFVY